MKKILLCSVALAVIISTSLAACADEQAAAASVFLPTPVMDSAAKLGH